MNLVEIWVGFGLWVCQGIIYTFLRTVHGKMFEVRWYRFEFGWRKIWLLIGDNQGPDLHLFIYKKNQSHKISRWTVPLMGKGIIILGFIEYDVRVHTWNLIETDRIHPKEVIWKVSTSGHIPTACHNIYTYVLNCVYYTNMQWANKQIINFFYRRRIFPTFQNHVDL